MADEVKPADSAAAPAGSQAGSPEAKAAPVTDASQVVELQRLRTELGIERKRREDTQAALSRKSEEAKRLVALAQGSGYESEPSEGLPRGVDPEVWQATVERTAFFTLAVEQPDSVKYADKIRERIQADSNLQTPDPYNGMKRAFTEIRAEELAAENIQLRAQLEARGASRERLAIQAVSSGVSASETTEELTVEDFRKMPLAEQRKVLVEQGIIKS